VGDSTMTNFTRGRIRVVDGVCQIDKLQVL